MRFAGLSPDERARLDAIGRVWNDDLGASRKVVLDVYRDHHQEKAANDGIVVHRDLAYGADPAHRLDVFESSSRCASGRGRRIATFLVPTAAPRRGR